LSAAGAADNHFSRPRVEERPIARDGSGRGMRTDRKALDGRRTVLARWMAGRGRHRRRLGGELLATALRLALLGGASLGVLVALAPQARSSTCPT
jgi:hypothetical protein